MAEINISNLGGGGGGTLTLTTTGTGGASTYVAGVLNIPVYQSALTNPVTGTGTATRVAFWDSASSVSSSANLYWDDSNSRLGVGTATPGARLQVNGTGLTSGTTGLSVKDSGGTDNFTVADNGATFVRGVLTISGSSASNSATLMGRTSTGEVTSVTLGTNLSFSGNTLNVTGGTGITSLNGLTAATQTFATGTTGTDFNISSATSTHTFNLPTASATNRGALSSADWTTFNNKVGGSGTATRVAFWSAGSTLSSNANLFWDNTNTRLGIGTSSPACCLQLIPTVNNIPYFQILRSGTSSSDAFFQIATASSGIFAPLFWMKSNAGASDGYQGGFIVDSKNDVNIPVCQFMARYANGLVPTGPLYDFANYAPSGILSGRSVFRIWVTGNATIQNGGTYTDGGYRLDVNAGGVVSATSGAFRVRGPGATSGTWTAQMHNSSGTNNALMVRDDGIVAMGTASPNSSARLDITSTTQGVLLPRMTTTDRGNIASPADGLTIYNTTTKTQDVYNNTLWLTGNAGLTGSATLDFGSTAAQTSSDLTITVTGAADGDVVSLGIPNASVNANTNYTAWVSAANTVTVRFNNYSSAAVDPASGTFRVFVTKFS